MKKNLFAMLLVGGLFSATTMAQGVSKLFGLVGGSPQANQSSNGFLFNTDSSGNNLAVQYPFPVTVSGSNPQNLEMVPYNGKLYGTTSRGGNSDYGTIFEYDPTTNTYTKKFDFGPIATNGGGPKGSLLLYNNKFYGLGADYGVNGGGCIFEWDPATNVYTKKIDFTGTGGSFPGSNAQNSLRLYNGKMYGLTASGGGSNIGVAFEWDPATNAYTKLFELNGTNGWSFYGNVTVYNGKLYCISHQGSANGYGAIYAIDPALPVGSNTTVVKVLDATTGGTGNNNEMIVYNNKLYGCLYNGGANSRGVLFELDPADNTFTRLVSFNYTPTGGSPLGRLVPYGGKFLGLCSEGGVNGTGTVYEWDPANPTTVTRKANFGVNNFDNPVNPISTLAFFGGKFYGTVYNSGYVNQGTLFEYDPITNAISKKKTFNAAENGRIPYGKPVLLNGKLYGTCYQGPQEIFGTPYGCIWSFDPATNVYAPEYIFNNVGNAINGRAPTSSPVRYNNKLYGTTNNGGSGDLGVLYEFDPVTKAFAKKDMQPIGGSFPIGEPAEYGNKLYGMTNAGGAGNNGIIYEYNLTTGVLVKLYDVQNSGSLVPTGSFAVYNNKLYGTTSSGGANNLGGIIAYDPATNTTSTVFNFVGATGYNVANTMTFYNNVFYGTALSGGTSGRGCIFRFDPANNAYTVVHHFTTAPGTNGYDPKGGLTISGNKLYCITQEGNTIVKVVELDPATGNVTTKSSYTTSASNMPVSRNGLTVVPAFIANGTPSSCQTFPTITIDATNNNRWVPILNASGDVLAEIKANGNNLGLVSASVYINNGPVRENQYKQLYMDRNLTITTQNPVSSGTVDIRLYVKTAEFVALKNAVNSLGQPSGINTINDVSIFKNEQACAAAIGPDAFKMATTATPYEYGYVLSTSISSFSTFYFASSALGVLPVRLLSFKASACNNKQACINWLVESEQQLSHYRLEKSADGVRFEPLQSVPARNTGIRDNYSTNDLQPFAGDNYYRLKMVDRDGTFSYSPVERVNFGKAVSVTVQPNPASDRITLQGLNGYETIQVRDMDGRLLKQARVTGATIQLDIRSLAKGAYTLQLMGQQQTNIVRFIKL
jgi:uncharacterized repeat protein (TIGR03803 family)